MGSLEGGAIANGDEQRQVGHYWLRHPQLAPDPEVQAHIATEIDQIEAFGRAIVRGEIKAPRPGLYGCAVDWYRRQWLRPPADDPSSTRGRCGTSFHFFDNVDPNGMSRVLAGIGDALPTTLVITVSKSGGTPEPHLGMEQARHRVEASGGSWAGQAVAITMANSKLIKRRARKDGSSASTCSIGFERTSITSAVGLVPGALIGADIREFRMARLRWIPRPDSTIWNATPLP